MKQKLLLLLAFLAVQTLTFAQNSEYVLFFDQVTENQSIKYNDDATTSIMDGATDYTIEMWVLPTSNMTSGQVLLTMRNTFRLTFYTNNRFYFTHKDNSSGTVVNTYYNVTDNALTIDQWNHIAVVCNSTDGANGSIKLYVNGVDVSAQSYEAKPLVGGDANNDIFVSYGGGQYSNMMAREIRIKRVAVDPSTFHIALTDNNYTTDADTAVLFHFAEGTGLTTVNAASGVDANFGFGGAHYPTWVLLTNSLKAKNYANITFSIYPNPVTENHFVVQTNNNEVLKSVEITDILGKVVRKINFNESVSSTEIATDNLRKGIYLVKTITDAGIGTQKLVIK